LTGFSSHAIMTPTLEKEVVVRVVEQPHDTYALLAAIMAILGFVIVVLGKVPRPKSTNLLVRLLLGFGEMIRPLPTLSFLISIW
jgi:hypothetical protein